MTRPEIARRRMYSQRLWGRRLESPEAVVGWLGAVQSQDFGVAKWSVAQRSRGATEALVDQAFADGSILRTHVLRPTWHFVLPRDIRWMLELSAPRVHARNGLAYSRLALDGPLLSRTHAALATALEGGRHLMRGELGAVLEHAGITASGVRLAHILMHAELEAVICSGRQRGKQHTYALLDERAEQTKPLDHDEALAELARRFFRARGPATVGDFARWSSLLMADARGGLAMIESELGKEIDDGRTYWFGESASGPKGRGPVMDLVQGFDESLVAYTDSKDVVLGPLAGDAVPGGRPLYLHGVLLDGQLVGHWRPVRARDSFVVEAKLHRRLTGAEAAALEAAVDRFGQFLEIPTRLALA